MPTILEQLQYGFDRNSRRTWQRRSLTDTQDQHYGYDTLGQVSAAARSSLNLNATAISGRPASAQSWDYDSTGNWRGYHSAANGTTTLDQHRVHDRGNRLTQIEGNPNNMILDRVGRMRQTSPDAGGDWDGRLEITWDAWSRITSVKNNGEVVGDYAYDGSHRRITREVDGETLHSYYNDAWRPVEERKDDDTAVCTSYLWGTRFRDDLVRRDRATTGTTINETRYILMDYFNPAAITDVAGEVKERYAFSAFGVRTIMNPDFSVRSSSECGLEFAFQGQFLDSESWLMNYGYRYYSPQLGRWTCKDPIGEQGGINLYVTCDNQAVNYVDRLGLVVKDYFVYEHWKVYETKRWRDDAHPDNSKLFRWSQFAEDFDKPDVIKFDFYAQVNFTCRGKQVVYAGKATKRSPQNATGLTVNVSSLNNDELLQITIDMAGYGQGGAGLDQYLIEAGGGALGAAVGGGCWWRPPPPVGFRCRWGGHRRWYGGSFIK